MKIARKPGVSYVEIAETPNVCYDVFNHCGMVC